MELETFCDSESAWRKIGEDHAEITTGVFEYIAKEGERPEKCIWWTMKPMDELKRKIEDMVNGIEDFDPKYIEYIHTAYGGDHGKGKFRFVSKLILRLTNGKKICRVYPLGDISCRKDNGIILKNTIIPSLSVGINQVEECSLKFEFDQTTEKWKCLSDDEYLKYAIVNFQVKPIVFLTGDIAFLNLILGKEDFNGDWCYLCDLYKSKWQSKCHEDGNHWTLERLCIQARKVKEENLKGTKRHGVREEPYFKIPVERVIWPVLHTLIGIGNNILQNLVDFIDNDIESLPFKEIRLRESLGDIDERIHYATTQRDQWDESENGLIALKKARAGRNKIERALERGDYDHESVEVQNAKELEKDEYEKKVNELENERKEIAKQVRDLKAMKTKASNEIKEFKKQRKQMDGSIYTFVDRVLQKYGIIRAAYHGGDLNGGGIIILMENAHDIMSEIKEHLLGHAETNPTCSCPKEDIENLCDDHELLLTLWDGALSEVQIKDPTEANFERAQWFIKCAMEVMRDMGFSVTPKAHGMEKHVVAQMRNIRGGIGELIEYWIEQYHQVGFKYDMKYRNMSSDFEKAVVRAKREKISMNPGVVKANEVRVDKFEGKRKKPDKNIDNNDKKKKIKIDRRNEALKNCKLLLNEKKTLVKMKVEQIKVKDEKIEK